MNYKISFGLKLLSSQGTGTYDSSTGIWSVGTLPVGGDATLELILQSNNAGSIVNTATVYSDLPDLNPLNNQAGFNLVANAPNVEDIPEDELNGLPYTFPPDIKPPNPLTPPDTPLLPPTPPTPPGPTPPDNPPIPPNPNPPAEPQKPSTQLGRDIAGVRQAVSQGALDKSVIPDWDLDPFESTEERDEDGIPLWVYLMAILGFITAYLMYKYSSALSEYLMTVWTGILNVLSALWLYLTYFIDKHSLFLKNAIYNVFARYGNYITSVLQEIYLTPLTGFDLGTAVGIFLRTVVTRYPLLGPILEPVIYMLNQYSFYQAAEKLNEFFKK